MTGALKTAFRCGIRPAEFWTLTPFETRLCVEAMNDMIADECRRDLSVAWHTAWMQRVDVKHFPRLSDLIKVDPKGVRRAGASGAEAPAPTGPDIGTDLMNALLKLPAKIVKPGDAEAQPEAGVQMNGD